MKADMQITALGGPFDDEDPLQVLRANVELNKEIGRREAVAVRRARMQGLTWSEIAGAMGVSRQAVHRKYGGSRFKH